MPRSLTRRLLRHLFLVSLASCVLAVFSRGWDEWDERAKPEPHPQPEPQQAPAAAAAPARKRSRTRRLATTMSFSVLFFAGLALSAGAGNTVRALLEDGSTDATATVGATGPTGAAGAKAAAEADARAVVQATPSVHSLTKPATAAATARPAAPHAVVTASAPTARAVQQSPSSAKRTVKRATVKRSPQSHKTPKKAPLQPLDAEANLPGATVWIHGPSVDPTPEAARLRVAFARQLVAYSRQAGVDWALVLAVLRADGRDGRSPATGSQLRSLSLRLARYGGRANGWAAALSVSSQPTFADRVVALRHYYRAVGMASLVHGLLSQKRDLEDRVLHDQRLLIYPGGRSDVAAHKVDVRVLAVMLYLADTFHQVTVSCLISGHRLYARPGVVSAHIYGRAADVAALGGVSIYGHQQPGGVTEQAVRAMLFLPGGMLPAQLISLLGLGGPSFPLANHYDHIHVGY